MTRRTRNVEGVVPLRCTGRGRSASTPSSVKVVGSDPTMSLRCLSKGSDDRNEGSEGTHNQERPRLVWDLPRGSGVRPVKNTDSQEGGRKTRNCPKTDRVDDSPGRGITD